MIRSDSADSVWLKSIDLLRSSETSRQNSRSGSTIEILHHHFSIEKPRQRWVCSRVPAINPAFAIVEAFWILAGRDDSSLINYWNPLLPKFAGQGDRYYGAYGNRIRQQFGFDQLESAYIALKSNPDSRQVVIQIWDPRSDFPRNDGSPRSEDIPCNICSILKVRDGKLEWLQIMRSNDLYRGLPYNVVQFTTIQEVMAGWLGLELGAYHQISDSLHVYTKDIDELSFDESGFPKNNDILSLRKKEFDVVLHKVMDAFSVFSRKDAARQDFERELKDLDVPKSYKNMVCIAACDAARRRGWLDLVDNCKSLCRNDLFVLMYDRWASRFA